MGRSLLVNRFLRDRRVPDSTDVRQSCTFCLLHSVFPWSIPPRIILPGGRRQMARCLVLLVVACSILVLPSARAAVPPCTKAIAGAVEKYALGKRKAIAKCEDKRSKGALGPSVNCRPADGPV